MRYVRLVGLVLVLLQFFVFCFLFTSLVLYFVTAPNRSSYGEQYTSLKPRVIKILTQQALRIDRPPPTQYGGIVGISLFGPRAVDSFLLPLARAYWERWEIDLMTVSKSGEGGGDTLREYELSMCQQALLVSQSLYT